MDIFFGAVMQSSYLDKLAEYGSGRGTFVGSTLLGHDPGDVRDMTISQVRQQLVDWLDAGLLVVPGYDEHNLLFVIFMPSEIRVTNEDRTKNFCGIHWWGMYKKFLGKHNLFFAVMDANPSTFAVSHELVEAFTDRSGNGWYSDSGKHSEIGDVCNSCGGPFLTLGSFQVAPFWLVSKSRCLQQADLDVSQPLSRMASRVVPSGLPIDKRVQFTVETTDVGSGKPVPGARVTVHNYTGRPEGIPTAPEVLPGEGSPTKAVMVFHAGRSVDPRTHESSFDKPPTFTVEAPGYASAKSVASFDMPDD